MSRSQERASGDSNLSASRPPGRQGLGHSAPLTPWSLSWSLIGFKVTYPLRSQPLKELMKVINTGGRGGGVESHKRQWFAL